MTFVARYSTFDMTIGLQACVMSLTIAIAVLAFYNDRLGVVSFSGRVKGRRFSHEFYDNLLNICTLLYFGLKVYQAYSNTTSLIYLVSSYDYFS